MRSLIVENVYFQRSDGTNLEVQFRTASNGLVFSIADGRIMG